MNNYPFYYDKHCFFYFCFKPKKLQTFDSFFYFEILKKIKNLYDFFVGQISFLYK